jgi:hypothetical protein
MPASLCQVSVYFGLAITQKWCVCGNAMTIFILLPLLGIITAMIAASKGRNAFGWWIYGALLFIVALPHALLCANLKRRPCPMCAEPVLRGALVCPHCRNEVPPIVVKSAAPRQASLGY